ncbi:ABC transporter permease [Rhizobium lentis]|uniref:ABC transporter permease n=1 Tax=Rhizobium lentis TaxID=1138194 RepID=UPI001C831D56|nr:ABC transporter permease [Rhizobium lentis]MBX5043834.1 ABC transporter permease [Rhizobium lentis]MBX5056037.1 ABC transporter permease [Rhizobium lentis]MBX5073991.1 ABC transporter permease [Rhizobium lentis]MBX5111154.1 ABC transporter permease [Rhizobium lentis]MBX5117272.1 ABC transporter permease [Rhizobium lentis]
MAGFIIRRLLYMIPMMFAISVVTFIIIQLPPGDFLTAMTARLASQNETIDPGVIAGLRERYGLDQPWPVQYWKWISGILLRGDFGQSLDWNKPVSELIWARMGLTMAVSVTTLLFVWAVAFPIGIYSAVRQYSVGDYVATFFGFLGLAIPSFLLALVLMFVSAQYFGQSVGGLFSPNYINAAWSWAKLGDLISHMWIPVVVLGTGATAALIRIMRANLLDELNKPYVDMARARGLSEIRLLLKYPVRVALNPFVSTVGWVLPHLVSGSVVVSIVLSLPITGPLLLNALFAQDMYLAGTFILLMSMLTLIGTLISDLLLAWLDPRIRNG